MIEQEHSWRIGVGMQMRNDAMWFNDRVAAEQCRLQHHYNDSEWYRERTKETHQHILVPPLRETVQDISQVLKDCDKQMKFHMCFAPVMVGVKHSYTQTY